MFLVGTSLIHGGDRRSDAESWLEENEEALRKRFGEQAAAHLRSGGFGDVYSFGPGAVVKVHSFEERDRYLAVARRWEDLFREEVKIARRAGEAGLGPKVLWADAADPPRAYAVERFDGDGMDYLGQEDVRSDIVRVQELANAVLQLATSSVDEMGLAHMDLRLQNVLVNWRSGRRADVKLTDFAGAEPVTPRTRNALLAISLVRFDVFITAYIHFARLRQIMRDQGLGAYAAFFLLLEEKGSVFSESLAPIWRAAGPYRLEKRREKADAAAHPLLELGFQDAWPGTVAMADAMYGRRLEPRGGRSF